MPSQHPQLSFRGGSSSPERSAVRQLAPTLHLPLHLDRMLASTVKAHWSCRSFSPGLDTSVRLLSHRLVSISTCDSPGHAIYRVTVNALFMVQVRPMPQAERDSTDDLPNGRPSAARRACGLGDQAPSSNVGTKASCDAKGICFYLFFAFCHDKRSCCAMKTYRNRSGSASSVVERATAALAIFARSATMLCFSVSLAVHRINSEHVRCYVADIVSLQVPH